MKIIKHWIQAARLRTLPLAMGCVILAIAVSSSASHPPSFTLAALLLITTVLLQVLSNFANDYGDGVSGVDNATRQGPERMLNSGKVSTRQLKIAIVITAILALISGVTMLALAPLSMTQIMAFFGLGLIAIAAAILYTVGKSPYGYIGLGDIVVFIFFGPVAVLGGGFILTADWQASWWLLGITAGALATAVLNINNMRDIETDLAAGKVSIAARLGRTRAYYYHCILIASAMILPLFYLNMTLGPAIYLSYLCLPVFVLHALRLKNVAHLPAYNTHLKHMVLLTLIWEILLAVDIAWHS